MHRQFMVAIYLLSCFVLSTRGAVAQNVYQLYDKSNVLRSTAKVNNSRLEIFSEGVIYRYTRSQQFDGQNSFGFYNTTLDKVINWPTSNQGYLRIGDRSITGGYVYHTGHHIGRLAPVISGPPSGGNSRRKTVVVIESALPGGGLVTARNGVGGNIEIGGKNPNAARNQFYIQEEDNRYFSLSPVSDRRLAVNIPDGRADTGTNVHVWGKQNVVDPAAVLFRLRRAMNGYSYIETKLRRGYVWTLDGKQSRPGNNIRLTSKDRKTSQMFRISRPEKAGRPAQQDAGGGFDDYASGGIEMQLPPRPARRVKLKLANSQASELWVLINDRRRPNDPLRIKIPPQDLATINLQTGNGESFLFYEVSVYRLKMQSMVIDRTQPGAGVVTEQNFSPKSIGWFEIPLEKQEEGGTLDVYRRAVRSHNPGKAARIDPELWRSLEPLEEEETPPNNEPTQDPDSGQPEGPFGVVEQPRPTYRNTALAPHLEFHEQGVIPGAWLGVCRARMDPAGSIRVEQVIWETKAQDYTVEVPYTETIERDGKELTVTKHRQETRIRTYSVGKLIGSTFPTHDATVFLADGSRLSQAAARQALQSEVPAVLVQGDGTKLDARYLPMLRPTTPIIVSSTQPPTENIAASADRMKLFPTTQVLFAGIRQTDQGGLAEVVPYYEEVEQSYAVEVPEQRTKEVDGQTVTYTVMVPQTRTRTASVTKEREVPLPPDSYRLYEMSGKKLAANATNKLAIPQAVVHVPQGSKIDPWYRQIIHPETIVMMKR